MCFLHNNGKVTHIGGTNPDPQMVKVKAHTRGPRSKKARDEDDRDDRDQSRCEPEDSRSR
jgi:hypothetical protein